MLGWLDRAPPGVRAGLVGGTAVTLGLTTAGAHALGPAEGVVVTAVGAALAAVWAVGWWTRSPAPPAVDDGLAAARRVLLLRDGFDQSEFEARIAEIDAAIDAGQLDGYATADGLASVAAFGGAVPPGGGAVQWLAVELDDAHERIEVRRGARGLGLVRAQGDPAAVWQLWRVRRVA